jgi:PA14 domain
VVPAATPYSFGYSRFFVPIDWRIRYFGFDEGLRPDANPDAFGRLVAGPPLKTDRRNGLDYMSGGAMAEGLPRDRVALVAEGEVDLPQGQYTVRTISDDGIRVWMDDERIIDRWTPHESAVDTAQIGGGRRRFKVEYYEIGGFAELRFEILRR